MLLYLQRPVQLGNGLMSCSRVEERRVHRWGTRRRRQTFECQDLPSADFDAGEE